MKNIIIGALIVYSLASTYGAYSYHQAFMALFMTDINSGPVERANQQAEIDHEKWLSDNWRACLDGKR